MKGSKWEYLQFWNIVDCIYISLNLIVILANFAQQNDKLTNYLDENQNLFYEVILKGLYNLDSQRYTVAISVIFMWMRTFNWLLLFDKTAFYIDLIFKTIRSIVEFLAIMFVLYMMFGTSLYILNLGIPPEEAIMRSIFDSWILDAFQSQYEMSIGEYQLDAYSETGA